MDAVVTLAPVFFMLALGAIANRTQWVTPEQEAGMKSVLFMLLFPVMVFNALFTTEFKAEYLLVIVFMCVLHMVGYTVGVATGKLTGGRFAHVSRYLMMTVDGGNACFPLYSVLCGAALIGNIVLLDIACLILLFLVVPTLVSTQAAAEGRGSSTRKGMGETLKEVFTSSTVIAMLAGLALSLLGVYTAISGTPWGDLYSGVATMATQPIAPLILFTLGYDFKVDKNAVAPLLRTLGARVAVFAAGILAFRLLFPALCADKAMWTAVVLYFMCPPAFIMPATVEPLCRDDADRGFVSAFISMDMLVAIAMFTVLVVLG